MDNAADIANGGGQSDSNNLPNSSNIPLNNDSNAKERSGLVNNEPQTTKVDEPTRASSHHQQDESSCYIDSNAEQAEAPYVDPLPIYGPKNESRTNNEQVDETGPEENSRHEEQDEDGSSDMDRKTMKPVALLAEDSGSPSASKTAINNKQKKNKRTASGGRRGKSSMLSAKTPYKKVNPASLSAVKNGDEAIAEVDKTEEEEVIDMEAENDIGKKMDVETTTEDSVVDETNRGKSKSDDAPCKEVVKEGLKGIKSNGNGEDVGEHANGSVNNSTINLAADLAAESAAGVATSSQTEMKTGVKSMPKEEVLGQRDLDDCVPDSDNKKSVTAEAKSCGLDGSNTDTNDVEMNESNPLPSNRYHRRLREPTPALAEMPSLRSKSTMTQLQESANSQREKSASTYQSNIDESKYPSSCIVKLPKDAEAGDLLTIRWPTNNDQFSNDQFSPLSSAKKRKATTFDEVEVVIKPLLVKVTLQKMSAKRYRVKAGASRYLQVYAPWVAFKRASDNTLTSKQLSSIGIEGQTGAAIRRSRRKHIRQHGEGNFSVGHSRIGQRYQVSVLCIPSSDTWEKSKAASDQDNDCNNAETYIPNDQIWDHSSADSARMAEGNQYIDSLDTYQKARGIMTLHQYDYVASKAKSKFNKQSSTDIPPYPDKPEPEGQPASQKSHTLLEGTPLSQEERTVFNKAIREYRKQWPKIAKAVGTSVNRCLIHYYSTYKAGENRSDYLNAKGKWEQSDVCESCKDGGDLICCDGCVNAYHLECIQPSLKEVPEGEWYCAECSDKKRTSKVDEVVDNESEQQEHVR